MFGGLRIAFARYPVKVQVLSKRGNAIQISTDKAARIMDKGDGTQYYHLKKHNLKIKPPEYKYFFVDKKGKPLLFLYSPQQGQMFPINIDNPPELKIEDKGMSFWASQKLRQYHAKYPKEVSFWVKYAPYVLLGLTAALCFMIMFFAMPHLSATASSVGSIAAELARVTEMLTGYTPPAPGT